MKHIYKTIQGWACFLDLYKEMVDRAENGSHFVEVGCWKGKSASFMAVEIANSSKDIRFDCVDHFEGSLEHEGWDDLNGLYNTFLNNIQPVKNYINVFNMDSVSAARNYEENSIDFLMIDGGHDYDSVKADIDAWLPKMKEKGVMGFDDAKWQGVKENVENYFGNKAELRGSGKGTYFVVYL